MRMRTRIITAAAALSGLVLLAGAGPASAATAQAENPQWNICFVIHCN